MKCLLSVFICFGLQASMASITPSNCKGNFTSTRVSFHNIQTVSTQKLREGIKQGQISIVKEALAAGADPNYRGSRNFNTALHLVAYDKLNEDNMIKIATLLLKEFEIEKDAENSFQETALDSAVVMDNYKIAQVLKDHGVEHAIQDIEAHKKRRKVEIITSDLALMIVQKHEPSKIIQIIEGGIADVYKKNEQGGTLLHRLAFSGGSIKVAQALLDAGVRINDLNSDGETALDYAYLENHKELVDFFIRRNGKTTIEDIENIENYRIHYLKQRNETEFINSIKKNRFTKVKELIDQRLVDEAYRDERGGNLIHLASRLGGSVKIIQALLGLKIDVNEKNIEGYTPLHYLVFRNNNPEVVQVLLDAGVKDINTVNIFGRTAFDIAVIMGHTDTANFLKSRGGKPASKGTEVKFNDKSTEKLISSIIENDLMTIKGSIFGGANVNVIDPETRNTPFHLMVRMSKDTQIAQVLLAAGASLDAVNIYGETPLDTAIKHRKQVMIDFLKDNKTKPKKSDKTSS